MSTDYGLRCLDCMEDCVNENMGEYAAQIAMDGAEQLVALYEWYRTQSVSVEISAYWCHNLVDFIEWLNLHKGHRFVIVDEYGKEHPANKGNKQ